MKRPPAKGVAQVTVRRFFLLTDFREMRKALAMATPMTMRIIPHGPAGASSRENTLKRHRHAPTSSVA